MRQLSVQHFLSIKSAKIDILPYTVLIGPQASGKSILAKLSYFFSKAEDALVWFAVQGKTIPELRSFLLEMFYAIFPKYTIIDNKYKIFHSSDTGRIEINGQKKYKLYLSDNIKKHYNNIKKTFSDEKSFRKFVKNSEHLCSIFDGKNENDSFLELFKNIYIGKKWNAIRAPRLAHEGGPLDSSLYIPATRSLISILEKNVFSIYNKIITDPVLDDFGRQYEQLKNIYISKSKEIKDDKFKTALEISSRILEGKFEREADKEYISNKKQKNELVHTSSGQQSSLPLIISMFKPFLKKADNNLDFYIEEPEAHIHPEAQYEIVKLLCLINEEETGRHNLFITTHSPYILSAINNIILAGQAKTSNKNAPKTLKAMLGISRYINPNTTSAYKIEQGVISSIFDDEDNIIDADNIDIVSEKIYGDFIKIMELIDD